MSVTTCATCGHGRDRCKCDRFEPAKKLGILRAHMAACEWRAALALAASFPRLGDHKTAIERGHQAFVRPEFCRAIGRDPDKLIAEAIRALRERYDREESDAATA